MKTKFKKKVKCKLIPTLKMKMASNNETSIYETSNLQYCSLIWLFCGKAADNLINRTTKRAMRITYNSDSEERFDALLQRDGTLTIHKKICKSQW